MESIPGKFKFEIERFDGKGDFGLWKYKMIMQLELLGLDSTIQEVSETTSETDTEKDEVKLDVKFQISQVLTSTSAMKTRIQVLSSLPQQFDSLVDTLKYGTAKETLTMNDVINSAYSKEVELKEKGLLNKSRSDAEGLYVESRGRSEKNGYRGKSNGRGRSKSRQRFDKNKTSFFICGEEGHWKIECPERRHRESANIATEPKQPLVLTASVQDTKQKWIMDSGCSYHSTSNKEVMFDLKEFNVGSVLMANNTQCDIKGIGKIKIQNSDGSEVILTGVRYIPEVSRNLISYGMLEKSGCKYKGSNFKVQFYKDNKNVISGKYQDGVYYLQGTVAKSKKNMLRVEKEIRKKSSKTVTFATSLIQGPTPYGFETKYASAQGGDYFLTEKTAEIKSKASSEESRTESSRDDVLFAKEVRHKDGDLLAHVLAAPEELNTTKAYEEVWKKAGKEEDVDIQLKNEVVRKVSHILGEGIFGDRVKENQTLSKIHSKKNPADFLNEAVPGQEVQVRYVSA
ncbi:Retrovirus-related Pol polyprotein from transposon TNT 1-94 [Raphanus sativus]|nr:Retrovirus-related Pol polyprotein from transposon TNT 1-94 [Raphanus sativus]